MGKTRNKNHKQDEFLLQQVRHLKKELKRKEQEIKHLQRELNYKPSRDNDKSSKRQKEQLCESCGKGEIRIMDIGIRRYAICQLCKKRDKLS